jgi:HlyD family secretion protein
MKKIIIFTILVAAIFSACSNKEKSADAYGNFEAEEVLISSEVFGKIIAVNCTEGMEIDSNQVLAQIDTIQLNLKKMQLESQIKAVLSKTREIAPQINVIIEQKNQLEREKMRFEKLVADSAAPAKTLDDIKSQIAVMEKNIIATQSTLSTANTGILSEIEPIRIQILQIEDNIQRSTIKSPLKGTILKQFVYSGELANIGRAMFKIANISTINLKAYIGGSQLSDIKIGQEVKVRIDNGEKNYYEYSGKVVSISSKAEFTPKIIQTKEERVNLVYSIKIQVANDGKIKIGMPGELILK